MSQSRIEQIIEDLYVYVEGCKRKPFGSSEVIVEKDQIYEYLDEMRLKIPEEIRRCAKVVANRDQIIASAEERAERIIAEAKRNAEIYVQESEIMRQAYLQANEMISRATQQADAVFQQACEDADEIREGALQYTNDMLSEVEDTLARVFADTKEKTENMVQSLEANLRIVRENKDDLIQIRPQVEQKEAPQENRIEYHAEYDDDDLYDIDSDSFMNHIDSDEEE